MLRKAGYQPKLRRLRLITLTKALNILDISKNEYDNCFIMH